MTRILIAGMGNLLRCDDGFGVVVARLLNQEHLPDNVKVVEVGIGGIHLVHELMEKYDMLVIIDLIARDSLPGTVHVLQAEVPDLTTWPETQKADFLADTHYTTPTKAMILAKAVGVLPPLVYLVGCQPVETDELGIGLSEPVERATAKTIREIFKLIQTGLPAPLLPGGMAAEQN